MPVLGSLDLLSLSPEEQSIVRCLVQRSPLSSGEIAEQVQLDLAQLEPILMRMTGQQHLQRHERDGRDLFTVQLRRTPQRVRGISLLDFNDEAA